MCKTITRVKDRIKECMKSGESEERDILKTVLGEIQGKKALNGKMSEEECIKVFKKFKQGVEDTIGFLKERCASDDMDIREIREIMEMENEISIYDRYIPATMSVVAIVKFLTGISDKIKDAKSDGQATGIAMGFIKNDKAASVDGKDVAIAVKQMRENSE